MSFDPIFAEILSATKHRFSLVDTQKQERTVTFQRYCPLTKPSHMDDYSYYAHTGYGSFGTKPSHHAQMRIAEADAQLKKAFAKFEEHFDQLSPFKGVAYRVSVTFKGSSQKIKFQVGSVSINDVAGGYAAKNMPKLIDELFEAIKSFGLDLPSDTWWDIDETRMIFRAPSAEKALMIHHIFTNIRKIKQGKAPSDPWIPSVKNISSRANIEANFHELHKKLFTS